MTLNITGPFTWEQKNLKIIFNTDETAVTASVLYYAFPTKDSEGCFKEHYRLDEKDIYMKSSNPAEKIFPIRDLTPQQKEALFQSIKSKIITVITDNYKSKIIITNGETT